MTLETSLAYRIDLSRDPLKGTKKARGLQEGKAECLLETYNESYLYYRHIRRDLKTSQGTPPISPRDPRFAPFNPYVDQLQKLESLWKKKPFITFLIFRALYESGYKVPVKAISVLSLLLNSRL